MITGIVTDDLDAIIPLIIFGSDSKISRQNAVIDTGFNGWLSLPQDLINQLNLRWKRRGRAILGDGSECVFNVYEAVIIWDGVPIKIPIDEADSEPLVGMSLMQGYQLIIQVFEGLKSMNINLKPILTRLKTELTDLYGDRLQNFTLYGSQARGDAEPGSDIDVLVVLKPPVNPGEEIKRTGKAIADLSLDYDVVISCLFMDETHYQTRNGSLLRNIRKEGVFL